MSVARRFGHNLIRLRKRAGLSQEELGLLADLRRTEIGMLERGTRLARIDTLLKLKGSLDVSADVLLEGLKWHPSLPPPAGRFEARDDEA